MAGARDERGWLNPATTGESRTQPSPSPFLSTQLSPERGGREVPRTPSATATNSGGTMALTTRAAASAAAAGGRAIREGAVARGLVTRDASPVRSHDSSQGWSVDLPNRDTQPAHGSGLSIFAAKNAKEREAWECFCDLDVDNSGTLDRKEVSALAKKLAMPLPGRKLDRAFHDMCNSGPTQTSTVSFDAFLKWYTAAKETERREMRRAVRDVFIQVDRDRSGRLNKKEFALLATQAKSLLQLSPPFDLESDWNLCTKGGGLLEVSYPAFENWWKERLGVEIPDIPVLPEFMVETVNELSALELRRTGKGKGGQSSPTGERTSTELWRTLKLRLMGMVRMQTQWGPLHELYDAQTESRFETEPLPKWIRDPDSSFSSVWDLMQVVMLLYVAMLVPLRTGFDVEIPLWSAGFFIDLVVDVYFIMDVVFNFRLSYYNRDGTREDRPSKIAANYLRGWFAVDFFSCLPLAYITYFLPEDVDTVVCATCSAAGAGVIAGDDGADATSNFRAMKVLRLIRLSKMLRLARIRNILAKYGGDVNMQVYTSISFTVFTIVFVTHIMTCVWYILGIEDQTLPGGDVLHGWVSLKEFEGEGVNGVGRWIMTGPHAITLATRYVTSMYISLNAIENATTDGEKWFAILAEFVRDFILGLVAGLLTTISMSMNTFGDQEGHLKLRDLKGWMQGKKIPKSMQMPVTEYCHELWCSGAGARSGSAGRLNTEELFGDLPPLMGLRLTHYLYGPTVSGVPLFRDLSEGVVAGLCSRMRAMRAMPKQVVMKEGQPGHEMYMIISGEFEVTQGKQPRLFSSCATKLSLTNKLIYSWGDVLTAPTFWATHNGISPPIERLRQSGRQPVLGDRSRKPPILYPLRRCWLLHTFPPCTVARALAATTMTACIAH